MRLVKGLVGIALFFSVLYFGIQFARNNNQALSLELPGGWQTLDVELWELVLISAAVGAALTFLVFLGQLVAGGLARRGFTKRIKVLERELNDLRNMPLSAEKAPVTSVAAFTQDGAAADPPAGAGDTPAA
ncbi:MAG: hypothetical protein Q8R92_15345 [Deltaproteobacteria bacterium]|nr:hypothetical protein [Deltaproteobacteria bacterium]